MADPASITGLIFNIGSLLKYLYQYGKEVKSAQKEARDLCAELQALKGILSDVSSEQYAKNQDFREMLRNTKFIVEGLLHKLEPPDTKSGRLVQSLRWPLDSSGVKDALSKLERIKSWFLMILMVDSRSTSVELHDEMRALTTLVKDEVEHRKQRQSSDVHDRLCSKLAPVTPSVAHSKACKAWQGTDSGSWFLDGPFATWLNNKRPNQSLLVLSGKSGCGKTTLFSHAVEKAKAVCEKSVDLCVAYHYCAYNNSMSQEARNVLGSWVVQAAKVNPNIVLPFKKTYEEGREAQTDDLEQALLNIDRPLLLLVDAINESIESTSIVQCMLRLAKKSEHIRCFFTLTSAPPHASECFNVEMRPELVARDIELYIDEKIRLVPVLQAIPREELVKTLLWQSNGMFRWVDCQMNILADQITPKKAQKVLSSLPGTLNETYALILSQVSRNHRNLVQEALLWLSFSLRPLTLQELCEALVIEEGDFTIDKSCRIHPPELILDLCKGLVVWDRRTGIVTLAHSSVRAFLNGTDIHSTPCASFALDESSSSRFILRKCLTYLLMKDFGVLLRTPSDVVDFFGEFPLLEYASEKWALHAARHQERLTEPELSLVDSFMETHMKNSTSSNFTFWVSCLYPEEDIEIVQRGQPLYYMASFDLHVYIRRMFRHKLIDKTSLDGPWPLDWKCGRAMSAALQVACWRSSLETVELLLEEGADPNSTNVEGVSCMFCAYTQGNVQATEALRKHGGQLNQDDQMRFRLWHLQHG